MTDGKPPKKDKTHFKPFCVDGETPRCQAFSKGRPGQQCLKSAKPGFRVCELHGAGKGNKHGGTPPDPSKPTSRYNPASPKYSGAKVFAYDEERIPASLRSRMTRLMNNPQVHEISGELLLIQARLEERIERVTDTVPMQEIRESFASIRAALTAQDIPALQLALQRMDRAIKSEDGERDLWRDIRDLIRDKSGLVEQSRRHRVESRTMITVEEFADTMRWMQSVVLTNVSDPQARSEIARQFRARAQQMFTLDAPPVAPAPADVSHLN